MQLMESIEKLIGNLNRLPGIGIKTAQRLAYHIITMPEETVFELADSIADARRRIRFCPVCGNYTEDELCEICSDPKRTQDVLCVVKDARDVIFMERMREFHGRYHVLGGVLSPMDGIGPDRIRIAELIDRVQNEKISEVILATNPDVEGEATASYIAKQLKPLGVRVTRIAHGIPIGGNLEYIDEITLFKAIENRREM
ncbi:MAG: recombination protein RecR [Christensenellaceae bacterium]|nr:recombination protein RecR [Christensenellaceae bacterium]